nr:hypothetical protein [uncultured Rhodopila sp.]
MPAPQSGQVKSPADGFLKAGSLLGDDIPGLSQALADTLAQALTLFLSMGMVLPGSPVAADPITGSGAVAGPGRLMPPPAGGPDASQLEGLANGFLMAQGIRGEDAGGLAKVIAGTAAQAIQLFAAQSMTMPGIAVAGFVTAAPGMLLPVPLAGMLQPMADGLCQQNGLRGEDAPGLAGAIARAVDIALMMFAGQVTVLPGIPAPPGSTAGPGRLM